MSEGKVWFITGCSTGFGRSLTGRLLERGEKVVATARDTGSLEGVVKAYGDMAKALSLDVNDRDQIESALNEAVDIYGRIDVLVNNAGYGLVGALEEYSEEQMQRNFDTNFWAAINLIREALPIFRNQRSGHIVNMSAAATLSNEVGFSIYGASKAALELASESLCWELKPLGIKVTIVVPGPFRTDFIKRSLDRAENQIDDYDQTAGKFISFLEKIEGKQPGDPDKAAEAIIHIVNSDKPPLYLYLGKYAYSTANKKLKTIKNYLDEWEEIGLPTDF